MTSLSFNDSQLDSVTIAFDRSLLQSSNDALGIYTFVLPYNVFCRKYRVESVELPATTSHVTAANNMIHFTNGEGEFFVNLTEGVYGPGNAGDMLIAEVARVMSAAGTANYAVERVEQGANTGHAHKLKITQSGLAGEFTIQGTSTASDLLGFKSTHEISTASVLTTTIGYRFDGPSYVAMLSRQLTGNKCHLGKRSGLLCKVPLPSPGVAQSTVFLDSGFTDLENTQNLNRLEVELLDEFLNPVTLEGQCPTFTIRFALEKRPSNF